MYMHRNMTDEFIGSVASCNIISTGSWYGDLPDGVPSEVKLNRKDYYIEEIQYISIKETISVTYGIKLLGIPFGFSPMRPLLWAPIGLK